MLIWLPLLMMAACGLAEGMKLPEGIVQIESEAFLQMTAVWVFIPESCTEISFDAFSDSVKEIYGFKDSAAQRFAQNTGRTFIDAGIYDVTVTCPEICLPNASVTVRASWKSAFKTKAVYSLWQQKELIASSENGSFTAGEQGSYDLHVTLTNDYCERTFVFHDALGVIKSARTGAESFEIAIGAKTAILDAAEDRVCTFYIKDRSVAQVSDGKLVGLQAGETTLTISVKQDGLTYSKNYPVTVYTPVERIDCAIAPFAYPGQQEALEPALYPANAKYSQCFYSSSNPAAVDIDGAGRVKYIAPGEAVITVATRDAAIELGAVCAMRPESLQLETSETMIAQSGTQQIETALSPAGSKSLFRWSSLNESAALVDENGLVTGVAPGSATIVCEGSGVRASVNVTVKTAPQRVRLSADFTYLKPGQTRGIEIELTPKDTELNQIAWRSSDKSVAEVDDQGVVRALSQGECVITATARSGFSDSFTLHVADYPTATGIDLGESRQYLTIGQSRKLDARLYPDDAGGELLWFSSDPKTVSVDADGTITGLSSGTAVITARLRADEDISESIYVNVLSDKRTLTMPLRRTTLGGIGANLKRIDNVRQSAVTELKALYARGVIGASELERRQSIISNAFGMYAFPWMVTIAQPYWNSDNSDGGVKDFQTGVVYYGLPYISGDYDFNRAYNVEKALSEERYLPVEGEKYFVLNQDKLLYGNYVGCDCSTFVGMSYFGCDAATRSQRTGTMRYSADYITLDREAELYPGDIIVAGYRHVVLFLYYANDAHTQIVIAEQGGDEATVNTISANVYELSYYYDNGFVARRYKYL